MKKITLSIVLVSIGFLSALAQGTLGKGGRQLNAGLGFSTWGVPVYVGADFGVHEAISVGPVLSYRKYKNKFSNLEYSQSLTVIGVNGNYHFNKLLNLPKEWNIYGGLTLGYYVWSNVKWNNTSITTYGGEASGIGLTAQVGARYFFSDNLGVNLEFGGGTGSGGNFGITYKF